MAVTKITILDLPSKTLNLLDDVNGFYCQLNGRCPFPLIMVKFLRRDGKTFWNTNLQTTRILSISRASLFLLTKKQTGTKSNIVKYITKRDLLNSELHVGSTNVYSSLKSTMPARRVWNTPRLTLSMGLLERLVYSAK